jgi:hypothetical protein
MLPQDLRPYACCFLTGLAIGLILAQQGFDPSLLGWTLVLGAAVGGIGTATYFDLKHRGQEQEEIF